MNVKGKGTILNALRFALGINRRKIILDFANPAGLRPRRICLFTGRVVPGSGIVAAVGLRPKRSENRCFYGMDPLRQSRKALTERFNKNSPAAVTRQRGCSRIVSETQRTTD